MQESQTTWVWPLVGNAWRRACKPPQYSCPENPTDRGAWWTTVRGIAQSQTRLKQLSRHAELRVHPLRSVPHSQDADEPAEPLGSQFPCRVGFNATTCVNPGPSCIQQWSLEYRLYSRCSPRLGAGGTWVIPHKVFIEVHLPS